MDPERLEKINFLKYKLGRNEKDLKVHERQKDNSRYTRLDKKYTFNY